MTNAVIHNTNFCCNSEQLNRGPLEVESNYYCNGNIVPRVSQILDMIKEDSLMDWAYAMGRRGINYKDVSKDALDYGTEVHRRAEIYINPDSTEREIENVLCAEAMESFYAFVYWAARYENNIKVVAQEMSLSCQWFGGTFDLLCYLGDKLTLVDYKTSRVIGYKYLLQLAAYDYLLRTQKGIFVDQMIVLQLNKRTSRYTEYVIDLRDPIQAEFNNNNINTFLSMVYTYYSVANIKNIFKDKEYKGEPAYEVRNQQI